jgi:hypothetical protein
MLLMLYFKIATPNEHNPLKYTQVALSSSSAGSCGSTPTCEPSVPVSDMSLTFHDAAPIAGEEVGMDLSMLVTAPMSESDALHISLQGFTSTVQTEFLFDSITFEADPSFAMVDTSSQLKWKHLGCITDSMSKRCGMTSET